MRQHVIPEWFLSRFATPAQRGLVITAYDKVSGRYEEVVPSRFMVEVDDHSDEIEAALGRIESPAANAARLFDERAAHVPPGICRVAGDEDPDVDTPEAGTHDGGVVGEMRLLVAEGQIRRLPGPQRRALARFMALMYSRAPKIQNSIAQRIAAYQQGLREGAAAYGARLEFSVMDRVSSEFERARWLGMREADTWGAALANAPWWVLKAGDGEEFVLGDSTVVATLALGHDDEWRRLIDPTSYAVTMPISPKLMLIVAAMAMIPITVETHRLVEAMNFSSYKSAERYVLSPRADVLRDLQAAFAESGRSADAPVQTDLTAIRMRGIGTVHKVMLSESRMLLQPSPEVLARGARDLVEGDASRPIDPFGDRVRPM